MFSENSDVAFQSILFQLRGEKSGWFNKEWNPITILDTLEKDEALRNEFDSLRKQYEHFMLSDITKNTER